MEKAKILFEHSKLGQTTLNFGYSFGTKPQQTHSKKTHIETYQLYAKADMYNIPQNMLLQKSHTKKCIRSHSVYIVQLYYRINSMEIELGLGGVCASVTVPVCGYKKS